MKRIRCLLLIAFLQLPVLAAHSDEGMWLFTAPPLKLLEERYGFKPSPEWFTHLQLASVRFNSGGSASFVSEDGLVISNHHVGADALHKLSGEGHDYLRDGFHARKFEDEKKCVDLELNVLVSIEDVTDRINQAVKKEMAPAEAAAARRAAIAKVEKASLDATGLRSDVVTLYKGGQYHLYRFKKYTDVRLVFAPEQQIAFFGGDPDNFEYPRYCMDYCFFRVYEDGKPAKVDHYLKWSKNGPSENELVFVSGHPGRTSRLLTVMELEDMRDRTMPWVLDFIKSTEVLLAAYSARSGENARRAKDELFGFRNARKAYDGRLAGLLDPELFASKRKAEDDLRNAMKGKPEFSAALAAWDRISAAQKTIAKNALRYNMLEQARGFRSDLFRIARTLLRSGDELTKPNEERLREFGAAGLESLKFQLFSAKPIYTDLEQLKLADSLTRLVQQLGYNDPIVEQVLAGKSPRLRATELIQGCTLQNVDNRKRLFEGGRTEINKAADPMIELARMIDDESRRVRKIIEAQGEIKQQAHAQLANARFATQGTGNYPDATFTLRLAFGKVHGYEENGAKLPYQTVFKGLYERAASQNEKPPFDLPESWSKAKDRINLQTPANFVSSIDIIGGNSGSPVVNRKGEYVGLIFDGNIHSLVFDLNYSERQARAISVHSEAIIESLRNVYQAKELLKELGR